MPHGGITRLRAVATEEAEEEEVAAVTLAEEGGEAASAGKEEEDGRVSPGLPFYFQLDSLTNRNSLLRTMKATVASMNH